MGAGARHAGAIGWIRIRSGRVGPGRGAALRGTHKCRTHPRVSVVRSYLGYYTGSHQNSAVKRLWAGIVLGWVTSREVPVPHPHLLAFWPFADRKNPENRNVKRLFRSQTLPAISVGSSHSLPRHTRRYLPTCLRRPTPHATHSSSLWLLRVSCVRARAVRAASQGAEPYPARRLVTSRRPPRGLNTLLSNLFRTWTT